jgi:hypothetical protein
MDDFQRCQPIGFGHRLKVKRRLDEGVHRKVGDHGHLADMNKLFSPVRNDLNTKDPQACGTCHHFQNAEGICHDVCAGDPF